MGWVAAHEEAINLSNAADHPGFRHIPEIGDESFHGFMGAPIIHHGRVLGVLVAQKHERRRFDNDEAAFFTTLAAQLGWRYQSPSGEMGFQQATKRTVSGENFYTGNSVRARNRHW